MRDRRNEQLPAMERLLRVREALIKKAPLYGLVALQRELVVSDVVSTAATDGKQVIWNPDFLAPLKDEEIAFFFKHEFWHVLRMDHLRFDKVSRKYRDKYPEALLFKVYNIAADYLVNYILHVEEGLELPKGVLFDWDVGNKDTEQVFEDLLKQAREKTQEKRAGDEQGQGESKEGDDESGSGGGEGDIDADVLPEARGVDVQEPTNEDGGKLTETQRKEEQERAYREIRQASNAASKAGMLSPAVKMRIDEEMAPSATPQEVLTHFLQDALCKSDYTYTRPNKRYRHTGFCMPSLRVEEEYQKIVCLIDVSGSVSDDMVKDFCGDLQGYVEAIGADAELVVVYVDTEVAGVQRFVKGDDLAKDVEPVRKTYGTDFVPGFEWIEEQGETPSGVVYYTDGFCSSFPSADLDPGCPVVWVLHREHSADVKAMERKAPFGDVLKMR